MTGYVYIDLKNADYGGFARDASQRLQNQIPLAGGYSYKRSGEYEFQERARQRLKLILPIVFFVIFLLLYMVFHSAAEAVVLIVPTAYALTGGLLLQWLLHYNVSVAVWVGYIALFGIAVETGVVMVVYLHETLARHIQAGEIQSEEDVEAAVIEGAVQRLRPKLMTVCAVLASLAPILWESGVGSDVMKPNRRSHRGWHDYVHYPRALACSCLLSDDEDSVVPPRHSCADSTASRRIGETMFKNSAFLPILLLSATVLQARPTEFRGTLTDSMCGKHHMMKNASAAECTRTCVKSGADFALVRGGKLYILGGDKSQLDRFAGSEAVVSGDLSGNSLNVKQIKPAR